MRLTDYPWLLTPQDYTSATKAMVEKLKQYIGVVSIYQIGGVSNPGISDVDLFVVFDDDIKCIQNPLDGLSPQQRYLFVHNVFGTTHAYFRKSQVYDFFHDYKLIHGRDLPLGEGKLPEEQRGAVNVQAALEYLVKMYVNMTIERTYGILRVRGLLLLAKAIKYDLEYLKMDTGAASDLIGQIVHWRNTWFAERISAESLTEWHDKFYAALREVIENGIAQHGFFIPTWSDLRIAANMTLVLARTIGYRHRGVCLPSALGWLGRKYYNIQHRMNRFVFEVPFVTADIPVPVLERHNFITEMCLHNSRHIPSFVPAPYGLPLFRRK